MQGTIKYPHPKNKSIKNVWTETTSAIYWTGFVWYLINPEIYPLQIYTDFSESNKTSLSVLSIIAGFLLWCLQETKLSQIYIKLIYEVPCYTSTLDHTLWSLVNCLLPDFTLGFSYDNYRENNTIRNVLGSGFSPSCLQILC